jgi:uncharacterized membrane protein YkvA (DUF1232 family)
VTESGSFPARKAPAKKTAPKRTAAKRTAVKKAAAKKAAPGTAAKRTAVKKAAAKKAAPGTAAKKSAEHKSPASKKGSRLGAAQELARSAPMSRYFANARTRARRMLDDPEALRRVADESYSSGASRSGPFAAVIDDFRTLVRLVVAYARGNYRDIPPDSLALIVAGLVYVVSPLDLIPDAIPVGGFMDDAVVIGWVIKSVRQELDGFRAWELGQ